MTSITIALTRYKEPDWLLNLTLQSLASQKQVNAKVHVLDQSFHQKTKDICTTLCSDFIIFEYSVIPAKGCSYARNVAIRLCETDILLWTDPDIVMTSNWAHCLSLALLNNDCAIVGSKIVPRWYKKPHWYMKSNIMTDQYSLIDYGPNEKEIDRVIGGSLGINTRQMGKEAYFDKNLGRRNGKLLGGIDSEFCERAIKKGFKVYYCGCTIAQHQILESRMTLSWSINKFYYSGYSRAIRGGRPSSMNKKREIVDCLVLGLFAIFYITGLFVGSLNRQNMEKP